MKFLIFIIIFMFPHICNSNNYAKKNEDYNIIVRSISFKISHELEKKYDMRFIGFGGEMMYCVEMLSMTFEISHPLQCDEARNLIVNCMEEYLFTINADKQIRPYLKNYPFKPENIEIAIHSCSRLGEDVYDPSISVVYSNNGKIFYKTRDKNKKYGYKFGYEETFEEAFRLIN